MEDLNADIQEVQKLLAVATRPKVKSFLESQLTSLNGKLAALTPNTPQPLKVDKEQKAGSPMNAILDYVALTSYSWEQDTNNAKVGVSLDNVGSLPADKVVVTFTSDSVEVRAHGLNGKNYRFTKLVNTINPTKSSYKVRSGRVMLTLAKATPENWDKLEPAAGGKGKAGKGDDGNGMMEMMKNMYEDGDDETKKMIEKTMLESRQKQQFN